MAPLTAGILQGGSDFLSKIRSYYSHKEDPPLISPQTALLCALLYTLIYVAPFYLSATLRSTPLQSRDAPAVIQARVRSVGITCVICTVIAVYVLVAYGHATPRDVGHLLGIWPIELLDIAKVLGLVMVLFVGPLYESVVVDGDWRGWSPLALKIALYDDWIGYRNLIVAPTSEELVFRACTVSVYLVARVNPTRIVFTTPLIFGLAHVHHLVEFLQSRTPQRRRWPPLAVWVNGIVRSLFQFTYTSLFGFFAAFVFLRTGNMWATTVAHSFCNWQGVPRMSGRVGQIDQGYEAHITPDVAQGKRDEDDEPPVKQAPKSLGVVWTVVYYVLLFVGAYGFYRLLWPLTESSKALAAF